VPWGREGSCLLKTETVRIFDEYAFNNKSIREVFKQLDPTNIKILSTLAKIGPRNLLEVARLTGIPFTTVYHRIAQMESKANEVVHLIPNVSKLGMVRVVLLVAAKPGLEDIVTQALRIPNYWRALERCEGAFTHHSIQVIPVQFLKQFREYISTMQAMNLIKSYRIVQTGDSCQVFPDFSNYNTGSGEWIFDWEAWLNAARSGSPTEAIADTRAQSIDVEKIDLELTAYLEQNGRMSFADIARKINACPQVARYHYFKLRESGIIDSFDFDVAPYPIEMSTFHEFMLEFADSESMNRFYSLAMKLFFIDHLAKALRKNTLLVRTRIINSQVENMFTFFSELVNAGQLTSYSGVRLNMNSRFQQTISFELFDDVSGWQWDVYRNLLELNKL
jgi:DNA-binding Lrp family transcriptional regulator